MAATGQTINDRLNAVRYALVGQGLARTVCKATTLEVLGPKKKHIDYLIACTNEPNISIPQLANLLIERTQHTNWAVVFKALISIHHLMSYGNERFTQYLATSNHSFELADFMDRTTPQGYNMSAFVRRYAKYINDKSISYRTLAIDLCKISRGNDNALRTMNMDNLSKTLPIVQAQFDSLLEFCAEPKDLNNGVIMAAFRLLYKDLVKLYVAYQEAIINLLERYFKLSRKKTREALEMYKNYLNRMDKVAGFLRVVDASGLDKSEMPDLTKSPASILKLLEQHLATLEAKKRGITPVEDAVPVEGEEGEQQQQSNKENEPPKETGGQSDSSAAPKEEVAAAAQPSEKKPPAPQKPARPSPKASPKTSPKVTSPSVPPQPAAPPAKPAAAVVEKKGPPERPAKPPSRPPPPAAAAAASASPSKPPASSSSSTAPTPPPPHPPPPTAHHHHSTPQPPPPPATSTSSSSNHEPAAATTNQEQEAQPSEQEHEHNEATDPMTTTSNEEQSRDEQNEPPEAAQSGVQLESNGQPDAQNAEVETGAQEGDMPPPPPATCSSASHLDGSQVEVATSEEHPVANHVSDSNGGGQQVEEEEEELPPPPPPIEDSDEAEVADGDRGNNDDNDAATANDDN